MEYVEFDPVAKKGQNLGIWTQGMERYFRIRSVIGMPASSQSLINFGSIAAGASTTKAVQATLQLDENNLLQLRCAAVDDAELQIWEPGGSGLFTTKGWQARVSLFSRLYDPSLKLTQFFVFSNKVDAQFVAQHVRQVTLPMSRFMFWGWRYIVQELAERPTIYTSIEAEALVA